MKTFLTVYPSNKVDITNPDVLFAHMAYKIRALHLMRGRITANSKGGIMVITDIDTSPSEGSFKTLAAEIYNECLRRSYEAVILDFEAKPTASTSTFASNLCDALSVMKVAVYVPCLYSIFCPDANYIISTAISGGSLSEHLEQMMQIHGHNKLALEIERIAMDFIMPSPSSEGKILSSNDLASLLENTRSQTFYSPELCTNYFTYSSVTGQTHFVLFDNAHSIADKLNLAKKLGFKSAFLLYPEISDIFQELSSYL